MSSTATLGRPRVWLPLVDAATEIGWQSVQVIDTAEGRVTFDRPLTHVPVVLGAVLALLVWRRDRGDGDDQPDRTAATESGDIVLPENASRGRRRGHLRPADGSAA
jgi:predicted anti-sigma-YlaC factor YlaD